MNQELVIGPSLIDFLMENYREGDFKSEGSVFLQRLQDDCVCMDENRELDNYIEEKIYENGDDLLLSLWTRYASVININRKKLENNHNDSIGVEAELAIGNQEKASALLNNWILYHLRVREPSGNILPFNKKSLEILTENQFLIENWILDEFRELKNEMVK